MKGKWMFASGDKVVAFLAHTDDEMCCAGTLHKLVEKGCEVHVVSFCPAATENDRTGTQISSKIVLPEWHKSMDLIGVRMENRHFRNHTPSDNLEPFAQDICQFAFDFCERERPRAAFILSPDDENTAHSIVGTQCERVLRGRVDVAIRCLFPWNHNIGRPNLYVELSNKDLMTKMAMIDAYESQKFRYRYGAMLTHYAHADGMSIKKNVAEKFEIIRCVI